MMSNGIALFGGTFDPIHHGHLIVARAVAEQLDFERVVFIPAPNPPHKLDRERSEAAHRLEMVRLAVAGEPRFEVSDIELQRSGPSYTILTVQAFRRMMAPDVPLAWIIGADTLADLHTWYRLGELVDLCRIVTAIRPGYETPDLSALKTKLSDEQIERIISDITLTPRIDISSTDIRRRLAQQRSIRYLLPEPVMEYIRLHGLHDCLS